MKYQCKLCEYFTENKSNFNKHMKRQDHLPIKTKEIITYKCSCGKEFSHASSLSRHKKTCDGKNVMTEIKELKEQLQSLSQELTEYKQTNKTTTNNNTYISVKNHINYIKDNYSSAPPLQKLEDYSVIEDDQLLDDLIYHLNHSSLDEYLGKVLIKYYKKEDSTEQSIWNSDVSRVTYIIRDLLAGNETIWNHDPKGVKTKEYIIKPLLDHLKYYISDYLDTFTFDNSLTTKQYQKIAEKHINLGTILRYIDTDLTNDIVKYIAPYFHLNKKYLPQIELNVDN